MANELQGKRIAFLAADMVEQVELTEPWKAVKEAGGQPELISLEEGEIQGFDHYDKADTFPVDKTVAEANSADYAALILPGGVKNPDVLRTDKKAVQFAREFVTAEKLVGAICHGPWLLVEADVVRGRSLTSWPSLQTDIRNAGGEWVDEEVRVDEKLITSRKPADIPAFSARLMEVLAAFATESKLDRMVEQTFPASDPLPGPSAIGGAGASESAPAQAR